VSWFKLVDMLEEMKTCGVQDYRGEARKTQGRPHPITPVVRSSAVKSLPLDRNNPLGPSASPDVATGLASNIQILCILHLNALLDFNIHCCPTVETFPASCITCHAYLNLISIHHIVNQYWQQMPHHRRGHSHALTVQYPY